MWTSHTSCSESCLREKGEKQIHWNISSFLSWGITLLSQWKWMGVTLFSVGLRVLVVLNVCTLNEIKQPKTNCDQSSCCGSVASAHEWAGQKGEEHRLRCAGATQQVVTVGLPRTWSLVACSGCEGWSGMLFLSILGSSVVQSCKQHCSKCPFLVDLFWCV